MNAAKLPLPHNMHLRKGKYYVSVNAPKEIEHLYPDKRCRRSTGTSDKRLANERAAAIVIGIMNDFDLKAKTLDQFIEACRPYLEKLGSNVQQWYVNGKITVVEGRDKGADYYLTGELQPETSEPSNYLTYDIQTYEDIATFITRNGYSIPRHALGFLSEDERARLVALSEPTKPKVKDLLDLSQVKSHSHVGEGKLLRELAAKALGNYDNIPAQSPVKIDASPQKVKKFSELIEPYLESRKGERYKEINSRRTACGYFMEFAGDLPITDYKKIHAYDVALGLQDKGLANATISKNEPPPLNRSTAMFRKRRTMNGKQTTKARRDRYKVTSS